MSIYSSIIKLSVLNLEKRKIAKLKPIITPIITAQAVNKSVIR